MVRFKLIPAASSIGKLRAVHQSVPTDPGATDDCCSLLCEAVGLPNRQAAEEWLVFLRALELAAETDGSYHRLNWKARDSLVDSFESRVVGAADLLDRIEEGDPMTRDELAAECRGSGNTTSGNHPLERDTRIDRLLGWSVSLGVIVDTPEGYSTVAE